MVTINFLSKGVYNVNGRRLICKSANGVVCVRIGGGYMPIAQYLTIYSFDDDDNSRLSGKVCTKITNSRIMTT